MATFNELTFSTLLFLGLATRLATLPFLGMIAVIQTFVYPNAWIRPQAAEAAQPTAPVTPTARAKVSRPTLVRRSTSCV
jgi:hypothetical protein